MRKYLAALLIALISFLVPASQAMAREREGDRREKAERQQDGQEGERETDDHDEGD